MSLGNSKNSKKQSFLVTPFPLGAFDIFYLVGQLLLRLLMPVIPGLAVV